MEEKISIVIPVYNVENYLDECIESIVRQTYQNLEIIIVDDGSTDESGRKCDSWAVRDARIRVIHQKNGGLSEARNTGISVAAGAYIGFVDGDDVVFPDMYDILYRTMKKEDAQISCCKPERDVSFDLEKKSNTEELPVQLFDADEAMHSLVLEEDILVTVWNKLYSRAVIEGLPFEKGRYHEDEFWSYQVIARADRIVSVDGELYGYRQRPNSLMTQSYSLKHLDLLDARVNRLLFLEKNNPELVSAARCNLRFECIRAYQLSVCNLSGEDLKIGKRKASETAKQYPVFYRDYRGLPFGKQVWCFMSGISFSATCHIRNWLHFGP